MNDHLTRRLVAILYADVAEYSRLMGEDEDGTHRRLSSYLDHISATIVQHQGQIEHYAGDAVLAAFNTAVDALLCAASIQRDLDTRNSDLSENRRVRFRIGVNLGDVIVDRDDIYGDGVNVAARLESLAEPGGICISESVHATVGKKIPLNYEFIGERKVKNIARPVRAYQARLRTDVELPTPSTAPTHIVGQPRSIGTRYLAIVIVTVVLAGAGLFMWLMPWEPREEPSSVGSMAFPVPDKPSVAVLPFANLSSDPEQGYFADGMTEDLITDLSKIGGLFVIARNSSFVYKEKSLGVRQVAEELGVRYVLEGSVRRSGERVRVNAQLIDATTGGHIWANRYDGKLSDVFGLQDKVTRNIVTVLAVQLTAGDEKRFALKETDNVRAYDKFLQGWQHYLRQTPEGFRKAISHFKKALELDPKYSRAYAALAATYWEASKRFWGAELGLNTHHEARFEAEQFLIKAMNNPTALAHQVASAMYLQMKQYEEAIAEAKRAIAVDPNDPDSYVALASVLSMSGMGDEALQFLERAIRLNPHYPAHYLYQLGLAQFVTKQLEDAAASLERANSINPEDRWSNRLLLATYGLLGRREDAGRLFATIRETDTRGRIGYYDPLTIRASAFWHPFKNPEDVERFAEGLRKANVPD